MKLVDGDEPSQKMVLVGEGESHVCLYEQRDGIHGKEDINQSLSVSWSEKSWGESREEREEKRIESAQSATSQVAHLIINRVAKKRENGGKKTQDGCHTVVAESSRMLCRVLMPVGLVMVHARGERVTGRNP